MTYFSALHYAAKAEKSARLAEQYATQATSFSGRIIQLGFDGTLEDDTLVFKHAPSGVDIPYDLLDDYEYELDLAYFSTDSLPSSTKIIIRNGTDTINFVSALHRDSTTPVTVSEMNQVMRFNDATGYRWLFKAAFKVTPAGHKVFLLYPVISLASSGLEIGDIGIAPFGIDESLNLRRYLNGQIISQSQFQSFANKVKKAIELYPNLSATEENWQAEVTASVLGQCGKFVIDDTAGTIRLPKVVNINGLQDLALIGGIKAESLPNITGALINNSGAGDDVGGEWVVGSFTQTGALRTTSVTTNYAINSSSWSGGQNLKSITFDASLSSSTYQNDAPVQQEAVQYPYFIQVATGTEESLPAISEYKLNNPNFFGQSMWTDVTPNNASWLLSNGAFHSGYTDYYNWLLKIYNGTETVDGVSVKGVNDEYTDYDFVINTADSTFRLPLLNGSEDLSGDTFETITYNGHSSTYTATKNGTFCIRGYGSTSDLWLSNQTARTAVSAKGNPEVQSITFCSIDVKKGDTVSAGYYNGTITRFGISPATGNGSLYFYVGDTLQDAQLINAGHVLTDLATKTNSVQAAAASMPSGRYIDLTLGASGSIYTAPANGWFHISKVAGSDFYYTNIIRMRDDSNGLIGSFSEAYRSSPCESTMPVRKGDVVLVEYNATGALNNFVFIYAEGDK